MAGLHRTDKVTGLFMFSEKLQEVFHTFYTSLIHWRISLATNTAHLKKVAELMMDVTLISSLFSEGKWKGKTSK